MKSKTLRLLDYNRIIEMLSGMAGSELGRKRIATLDIHTDVRSVKEALTETTEAVSVIVYKGSIPVGEFGDISQLLSAARKGRTLSMRELLQVRRSVAGAREVKAFLSKDVPEIPVISEISDLLEPQPGLESEINRCILSEDEIADNASPELKRIRREIRNKNEAIKSRLYKYTSSRTLQKNLQDSIVTVRNGRYVVPVKREYASSVPGLVHDQSQSGSTLFIEPQEIVNMNNQLKELELAEEAEIQRILQKLTDQVSEHFHELNNNQNLLAELDVINAKGRLSVAMDACEPEVTATGGLYIHRGRHPLIDPEKVVPIDVSLGRPPGDGGASNEEGYSTLLITGPNTGGKTVTLKTIGLFILMSQTGLHIPCLADSRIPVLRNVFADIGDEQSIEQSLSTFSSHMKNISEIITEAGPDTLALLDELGSGTDPSEGAALAISLIEELRSKGVMVAATTHYTELKKYALSTPGVENASMEFDVETLSPTYRLRVGLPGRSNAFEISRKLGLKESVIIRASELLDENQLNFEDAVSKVEAGRAEAEEQIAQAKRIRERAEEKLQEASREVEETRLSREKILEDARRQAAAIIRDAQDQVEEVSRELKASRDADKGHRTAAVADSRRKLREAAKKQDSHIAPKKREKGARAEDLKVGSLVKVMTLQQRGEVETPPDAKGDVTVRIGSLKMNVNAKDLVVLKNEPQGNKERQRRKSYARIAAGKARTVKPELNVIGKNLDDASIEVAKYIDDAYLSGLTTVNIIHGRGKGILQQGLRDQLRRNKFVKGIKPAPYNQGGEGVTVVELKKK